MQSRVLISASHLRRLILTIFFYAIDDKFLREYSNLDIEIYHVLIFRAVMSTTQETAQIPVIDISGGQPDAEIGRALVDAAATYGFVYVKNEGKDIPVAAINRMFDLVNLSFCIYIFVFDPYLNCRLIGTQSSPSNSSPLLLQKRRNARLPRLSVFSVRERHRLD